MDNEVHLGCSPTRGYCRRRRRRRRPSACLPARNVVIVVLPDVRCSRRPLQGTLVRANERTYVRTFVRSFLQLRLSLTCLVALSVRSSVRPSVLPPFPAAATVVGAHIVNFIYLSAHASQKRRRSTTAARRPAPGLELVSLKEYTRAARPPARPFGHRARIESTCGVQNNEQHRQEDYNLLRLCHSSVIFPRRMLAHRSFCAPFFGHRREGG